MAGVIMASPKNSDAPAKPSTNTTNRTRSGAAGTARDSRDIVPPSPWLSARMTRTTYFKATTSVTARKMSESTPKTVPDALAPSSSAPAARSVSRKA